MDTHLRIFLTREQDKTLLNLSAEGLSQTVLKIASMQTASSRVK